MPIRIYMWLLVAPLLLGGAVFWSNVANADPQPPDQVAKTTAEDTLQEIRNRKAELKANPEALYQLVEQRILSHFDFDRINQSVLGKFWRDATPDQRKRFSAAFQHMLVRSYAHALLAYQDETINWPPLKPEPGTTDVVVKSTVMRNGSPPIPINYSMYLTNGEWKVYDVTIDAVSLTTNYRAGFATEIRKNGLDSLIARLEQGQGKAQ